MWMDPSAAQAFHDTIKEKTDIWRTAHWLPIDMTIMRRSSGCSWTRTQTSMCTEEDKYLQQCTPGGIGWWSWGSHPAAPGEEQLCGHPCTGRIWPCAPSSIGLRSWGGRAAAPGEERGRPCAGRQVLQCPPGGIGMVMMQSSSSSWRRMWTSMCKKDIMDYGTVLQVVLITAVCIIQGMRLFILKEKKSLVNSISLSILHRMIWIYFCHTPSKIG